MIIRWVNELDCNTVVLRSSDWSTRNYLSRNNCQKLISPVAILCV